MAYEAPLNILSPESIILEFKVPPSYGFWTIPHSASQPNGWGKPFETETGDPIPYPGTPGGSDPVKFVYWSTDDSSWKGEMRPGSQLYGNVDWIGKYKDEETPKEEKRVRLSYWGPQSRYFPSPGFIYGSDPKHNDIYKDGRYLSVAPLPVLGAAITEHPLPPPPVPVTPTPPPVLADWLVVVCRDGLDCVVYSRLIPSSSYSLDISEELLQQMEELYGVSPSLMTSALRERIMALYHPDTNPYGWQYMGVIPAPTGSGKVAKAPNTPWFFNESGDVAQCVQDVELTFDNGRVADRKELVKEIRAIVLNNVTTFTIQNIPNLPGFTYKATSDKSSMPTITVDVDNPRTSETEIPACHNEHVTGAVGFHWYDSSGETHYLSVDKVRNEVEIFGNYIVGVDYYEDEEIYLYLRYDCRMTVEKWWRYGVDKSIYPDFLTYGYGPISDGVFFTEWAWWDEVTGNLVQTFKKAVQDSIYANESEYLAAGQPVPPIGPFDGRLFSYIGLYGRTWLEWTHPVQGLQTFNLYRADTYDTYLQEEIGREYVPGVDPDWMQYFNYVHFFDVRPKDGFLAAYYQDLHTRRRFNSGPLGIAVTHKLRNLEYTKHPDNEEDKPDSFLDTEKENADVYNTQYDVPGQLCDMLSWNPTGAAPSAYPPASGTFSRNDFSWDYTVTQYTAEYVIEDDYVAEGLEPSPHYWHDNNGWNFEPWPAWRDLVSSSDFKCLRDGSMTFNGDKYLFSFLYKDAEESIKCFNYITDGDLESIVEQATRYYPAIGT